MKYLIKPNPLAARKPTIRIWRWITRRAVLASILGGFVIGFLLGLLLSILKIPFSGIIGNIVGFIFGLCMQIYFINRVIGQNINGYTLVLKKNNDEFQGVVNE